METPKDDYLTAYRGLKLSRDAEGVLVDHLHTNGGPSTFTAEDHTEFVDAFYRFQPCRPIGRRQPKLAARRLARSEEEIPI